MFNQPIPMHMRNPALNQKASCMGCMPSEYYVMGWGIFNAILGIVALSLGGIGPGITFLLFGLIVILAAHTKNPCLKILSMICLILDTLFLIVAFFLVVFAASWVASADFLGAIGGFVVLPIIVILSDLILTIFAIIETTKL